MDVSVDEIIHVNVRIDIYVGRCELVVNADSNSQTDM